MRDWVAEVRARLAGDASTPALPQDVLEEVAQHVADVHRAALLQGCSVDDADARAETELTNIRAVADAVASRKRSRTRAERLPSPLNGVLRDFSHARRLLSAKRAYAAVVVLTLALGIGLCTTVFSLFNSLLLSPLPFPRPEQLVLLWETDAGDETARFIVSAPNYEDWKRETRSFAALGLWEYRTFNVSADAEPEQVPGLRASASLFEALGVRPALGRAFTAAEDEPGHQVAVISDSVWRSHFHTDPNVLGRSIRLNGLNHEVIGVMPRGFAFPRTGTGVWTPIALLPRDRERDSHSFYVAGRVRDEVTFDQAREEVQRLGEAMRRHEENSDEGATVQRMTEFGIVNVQRTLVALSGAVGLVLLIACVNVASLQFALGLARRREFVTRLALGASGVRLAQQALVEALTVAAIGCAVGVAGAWALLRYADAFLSPGFRDLPMRGEVTLALDARVVGFAVATSALSALLFAFVPLIGLRRPSLQPLLREGERGATRLAAGTRRVLVTAEIALAIVVLSGAGLMVRSLTALLQVPSGLDARNVLTLRVSLPQADTYGPPERATFCVDLEREVGSIPGVLTASATSHLPLSGSNAGRGFAIEGQPPSGTSDGPSANYRLICPGYFGALGIPLLKGRDFTHQDRRDGARAIILNRTTAERYWPGADPVGQRVKLGGYDSPSPWMEVVGVVDNVKHFALEEEAGREIYLPYAQSAWPVMTIVARTVGEPMLLQRSVREALKRVELNLPAANARSMEEIIALSIAWRQTPMRLLTVFAGVGLLLAGLGVYGVLAYYVSQRTREFGVRVALGASRAALVGLVIRQSAWPVAAGVALGVAGSFASGQLLTDLLYGVEPGDLGVMSAIVVLLVLVSLLSSWIPARRAASVDPMVALREE